MSSSEEDAPLFAGVNAHAFGGCASVDPGSIAGARLRSGRRLSSQEQGGLAGSVDRPRSFMYGDPVCLNQADLLAVGYKVNGISFASTQIHGNEVNSWTLV